MTKDALKVIKDAMADLGIVYSFMEYKGNEYPYFVGEYTESPQPNEDGLQETTFILSGFSRGTWLELEEAKEKIKDHYNKVCGRVAIADNGSAVAIFYASSLIIPTGDAELKKIQINLEVKEWSVK